MKADRAQIQQLLDEELFFSASVEHQFLGAFLKFGRRYSLSSDLR